MKLTRNDVICIMVVIATLAFVLMMGGIVVHVLTMAESAKAFSELMVFIGSAAFLGWMVLEK